MLALKIARYALLISLLVYGATMALAAAEVGDVELLFLIGLVSIGWIVLSSIGCLLVQAILVLRRRGTGGA